ncbi:hypothetical protein BYT27DRAFT_7248621 [Phlegmacium glaucopus]|nr:hypothetical protein BYT27DRAFT_7248621 [Phlegmacium glaucopus]
MAQAMACGFENLKPRPQAKKSSIAPVSLNSLGASKLDPEYTYGIEANTNFQFYNVSHQTTIHQFPTDEPEKARSIHRKFSSAKSGVHAGPLRLLAHESWERLNTG